MPRARSSIRSPKTVRCDDSASNRLNNRCVACFNLAVLALMVDDPMVMFKQVAELEIYITPDMNVYKNIIATGLDQLLFRKGLLPTILQIEEVAFMVIHGQPPAIMNDEQAYGNLQVIRCVEVSSDQSRQTGIHRCAPGYPRRPSIQQTSYHRQEIGIESVIHAGHRTVILQIDRERI